MERHFRERWSQEGHNSGHSCRSGIQIDDLRRDMCAAQNGKVGASRGGPPQIQVKWPTGSRRRRRWRPCRRTPSLPADRQHKPATTAVSLCVSHPSRADTRFAPQGSKGGTSHPLFVWSSERVSAEKAQGSGEVVSRLTIFRVVSISLP